MKKIWKTVTCGLLAAMAAGSFSACGEYKRPSSDGSLETTDYTVNFNLPASTQASIRIMIPDSDPERKIANALIEGFNQKYPLIQVTINPMNLNSYNDTVLRQYQADRLAEIVWCDSTNYYYLVSNGIALNLDGFYEQGEAAGQFDSETDFTYDFLNSGKFNGIPYAVPRSTDSVVTFYNKEILAAAGVDLNPETTVVRNGWSWEDFLSVCEKVRNYYDGKGQTNYYPIDANFTWEAVSWPIIEALGGEVIGEDGKFALTEEKAGEVYDFVQNLVSSDYIPGLNESSGSSFESATGAMLFQSTTIDNYQTRATLKDKFDIVSFPLINGENASIGYGFAGYAVNEQAADDPDTLNATMAFINYMISYDGQQKVARDGGLTLPSVRTELSVDNPDASWHSTYGSQFNVAAYTYGSEYKVTQDFLGYVNPVFSTSIIDAMNGFVGAYCIRETKERAYTLFKGEIEDAFNSVVQ